MKNYPKGLFLLAVLIVFFAVSVFYIKTKENTSSFQSASMKIFSSWGPCSVPNGCHEVYELNSNGEVLYNIVAKGNLSSSKAKELIQAAFNLYKNNTCTRFDATDVFENYELNIDGKVYEFGKNQGGCKEMQNIVSFIKKSI